MPQLPSEEAGQELSDLAFGIVEQHWLEQHIGKVIDLKTLENQDAAEWELTYLILFAITHGCGSFSTLDPHRTTAILKSFHSVLLRSIADQAGQEIAEVHQKNLPPRYRLYGEAVAGEEQKSSYKLLGEAAAIQILGKPLEDPQTADNFRETIKVIFTEVREAAIKTMG